MFSKESFVKSLINRNLFWSYPKDNPNSLPDEILIAHVLTYGEPEDILFLGKLFKTTVIKHVWQSQLIPDKRFYQANIWLAKVFFNIRNVDGYLRKYTLLNSRHDQLKRIAAKH